MNESASEPFDLATAARKLGYRFQHPAWSRGNPRADRMWLVEVDCWAGTIGVLGPNRLYGSTKNRAAAKALNRLIAVKAVELAFAHEDGEIAVAFDPAMLEQVCRVLKAKPHRAATAVK